MKGWKIKLGVILAYHSFLSRLVSSVGSNDTKKAKIHASDLYESTAMLKN